MSSLQRVSQAFDGLEVGGELAGREAPRSPVKAENTVPAPLEAVRGEGEAGRESGGFFVKTARSALHGGAGHDELRPDKKPVGLRARCVEQLPVECVELQFAALRILAPRNKKPPPA